MILLVTMLGAAPLDAQARNFGVEFAAGAAVPTGFLNLRGGAGPLLRAGLRSRRDSSDVHFRLDVEALALFRNPGPTAMFESRGARAISVVYSVLLGPERESLAPYLILGAGLQGAQNLVPDAWPWIWTSCRIGAGMRQRVGRVHLTAEIAAVRAIRHGGAAFVPITVGVTF